MVVRDRGKEGRRGGGGKEGERGGGGGRGVQLSDTSFLMKDRDLNLGKHQKTFDEPNCLNTSCQ